MLVQDQGGDRCIWLKDSYGVSTRTLLSQYFVLGEVPKAFCTPLIGVRLNVDKYCR